MGIFNRMKYKAKEMTAPEGTVYFRGIYIPTAVTEENMPDDFYTLNQWRQYYGGGHSPDFENRDNYHRMILRRLYPMVKDGKGEDNHGWIERDYFRYAAEPEERINWFCANIENGFFDEAKIHDGRKEVIFNGIFHDSDMEDGLPYFEEHLEDIINSVCVLLEKEKQPDSALHTSFYMYEDLMDYVKNPDPKKEFTLDNHRKETCLWKKTNPYRNAANSFYSMAIKNPDGLNTKKGTEYWNTFNSLDTNARYNIEYCNKEELIHAYHESVGKAADTADNFRKGMELLSSHSSLQEKNEAISMLKKASEGGNKEARKIMLEALAQDNDPAAKLELAKDYYHGVNDVFPNKYKAYPLFMDAARTGNGEAMYYIGLYYEQGEMPAAKDDKKAEEFFQNALDRGYYYAYKHIADRAYGTGQNTDLWKEYYKKYLALIPEDENPADVKSAIARTIEGYSTSDVGEDTFALYALACDYARLDAPAVKEEDLLALLSEAEDGDYKAMDKLVFYYTYYSRGRQAMGSIKGSDIFESDIERAGEMRHVAKAFRLMKIAMLLEKANQDPETYLEDLAEAYLDQGNRGKAEEYADLGVRLEIPGVMYFVYHNAKKLDYEEWEAMELLKKSARLGCRRAVDALDFLHMLEENDRERAEWVAANRPKKTRADYAFELELMERSIDIMRGGSGSSLDELALTGKISFTDASLLRHYKNKFLDRMTEE